MYSPIPSWPLRRRHAFKKSNFKHALQCELLEPRHVMAGDFSLVKDVNAQPESTGSNPTLITPVGSSAYFSALGALWKTDGSGAGTTMVKDGLTINSMLNANGSLLFSATDSLYGNELWKSDGTTAGTVVLKDINPGTSSGFPSLLTAVGGSIFFTANDQVNGFELWKTDGTSAGTQLVKDMRPGPTSSSIITPTNVNGILYFSTNDGTNGEELWKSDGTAAGTVMVKDIAPASASSFPRDFVNVNGTLFFTANDGTNGTEVWKSDGSAAGTVLVKNIAAGAANSFVARLTEMNGVLYFGASDGTTGFELWKSDGTATGTVLVKDINPGASNSNIQTMANGGGTLYLSATEGINGYELWKSDGTAAGTVLLKDINSGAANSSPSEFIEVNGEVFFQATTSANGRELWKTNGTAAGTALVSDIRPGVSNADIVALVNFNGTAIFGANDGTLGRELWKSNGTAATTAVLKNILSNTGNSSPSAVFNVNGVHLFFADDGINGRELWRTDGTSAGTVLVKDINPGASSSVISGVGSAIAGGFVYFAANDGSTGIELWRSDGTTAGTQLVRDIRAGSASSMPSNPDLKSLNGIVYFGANDGTNGVELWRSDGTSAGTVMLANLTSGVSSSYPGTWTVVGNQLFFVNGFTQLARTDGTATGTIILKAFSTNLASLVNTNGTLYLVGNDGTSGPEIWRSNGSVIGTTLVKDIVPGSGGISFPSLMNLNGTLMLTGTDTSASRLWKSDGTDAGTVLVKDVATLANGNRTRLLASNNGLAYLTVFDSAIGDELWRSDGTVQGTVLVRDFFPGLSSSIPYFFNDVNGWTFFTTLAASGRKLWTTDGTDAGTRLEVADVPGDVLGIGAQWRIGNTLYASGGKASLNVGTELLKMDEPIDDRLSLVNQSITFNLPPSDPLVDVTVRQDAGEFVVKGSSAASNILGSNTSYPATTQSLQINTSGNTARSVSVDTNVGGMLTAASLDIALGSAATDAFSITANSADLILSQAVSGQAIEGSLIQSNRSLPFTVAGAESFAFSGLRAVELVGAVSVSSPMSFLSSRPLNLGLVTELSSSITSNSTIALGSGESLSGTGNVQGRFAGEAGSLVQATGPLLIGSVASAAGFSTRGELETGANTVTLRDANQAVLGSLTTLGSGANAGQLSVANGALIDFGNNLVGYGTLQSPNQFSKLTLINGSVEGTSAAQPITLPGYIKGVGTLNNIVFTGTYSPGLSPAAIALGNATYASSAVTLIEVGGKTAGSQHDQLNHSGQAILGGTLQVDLINGFVPTVGDTFDIITAAGGISGTFSSESLPPAPTGTGWNVSYGANLVQLQLVDLANVAGVQLGDGTSQHSRIDKIVIAFDAPVSIATGAFTLQQRGGSNPSVTTSVATTTNANGNTVATLTFSGSLTRNGGVLLDGYYLLTFDSSKIVRTGTQLTLDGDGNGLTGGNFVRGNVETDDFFALYGDINGDGIVNVSEFGQFRTGFGKSSSDVGYNALFDYEGDNSIGVTDFGQFRSRFGKPKLIFP